MGLRFMGVNVDKALYGSWDPIFRQSMTKPQLKCWWKNMLWDTMVTSGYIWLQDVTGIHLFNDLLCQYSIERHKLGRQHSSQAGFPSGDEVIPKSAFHFSHLQPIHWVWHQANLQTCLLWDLLPLRGCSIEIGGLEETSLLRATQGRFSQQQQQQQQAILVDCVPPKLGCVSRRQTPNATKTGVLF